MSDTNVPDSEATPVKKRHFIFMAGKIIVVVVIVLVIGAFAWAEKSRRDVVGQLAQTSTQYQELKKSTENSSQDLAMKVRENVSKLINLPLDPPPTVATISDVTKLRESNQFFTAANNGDFLILTSNRAILYNLNKNIILDVAPFTVNSSVSPSPDVSASPKTKAKATLTPSPQSTP